MVKARRRSQPADPGPVGETLAWPLRASPVVRSAGVYLLDDRGFAHHYQAASHALHLYDYAATMMFDDRTIQIAPGDMTISPAHGITRYDLPRPGRHYCIHFFPVEELSNSEAMVALPLVLRLGAWKEWMVWQMLEVIQLHSQAEHDPIVAAAASTAVQALLLGIAMRHDRMGADAAGHGRAERAVEQAVLHIEQNLSRPLTVPQIARQVRMSQNYLAGLFRRRYGMTMPRYILTRRIELAQQLLITTDLPVNRVAARVGLNDPQHFNKQFRRLVGCAPSRVRSGDHARRSGYLDR
ncbi:MAG: helix-turn-helix transcriptional regulator [Phycisphaeraceae bacterium]|nr:helix-turn-helix transcriptional regulator [Phycisphaeraceae bacterium]